MPNNQFLPKSSNKRIEAIGIDWIVARHIDTGVLVFAEGAHIHEELKKYIEPEKD